ncbi:hypothetical protein [Actinomadura geliboluensis]|uniref:hypothetical protein n=1 Tax=Actinomadura geliboluensis TaxID=882440 RepID=UPI00197AAB45|nr:hypothetical protein [Actinomadura geliboluensis]
MGNLTGPDLALGVILAPLYGCGALLARELGQRGGGWPTIALLAAAYALIEEGPVDQLLWNDDYAGHNYLAGDSYIPALGMSVELTQAILALHTVWSICVPIAIVEAFAKERGPWLGRTGLVVTAVLYVLGAVLVFFGNYSEEHFLASPAQLIGMAVIIVGLIVLAFLMPLRRLPRADGQAPSPWLIGAAALALTSAYMGPSTLVTAEWYEWIGVVVWCVVVACGVLLVSRWSRQGGWDGRHTFALAAGATLTYVWTAFPTRPEAGGSLRVDLMSNSVFGVVAIVILVTAGRRVAARSNRPPPAASLPPRSRRP